jgi:hypothetical protein
MKLLKNLRAFLRMNTKIAKFSEIVLILVKYKFFLRMIDVNAFQIVIHYFFISTNHVNYWFPVCRNCRLGTAFA